MMSLCPFRQDRYGPGGLPGAPARAQAGGYKDRKHSGKGEKDRRDIVKIGLLLGRKSRLDLIEPYMRDELADLLRGVAKSSVFHELCERNSHGAKRMREEFAVFVVDVLR